MEFSILTRIIFPLAAVLGIFHCGDAVRIISPKEREAMENIQKQYFVHESHFNGTYLEFIPNALRFDLAAVLSFELRLKAIDAEGLKKIQQQAIGEDNLNTMILNRNLTNLRGRTPFDAALTTLDLSGNQIQQIDADAFSGLEKLVRLHLEENHISHLADGVFTPTCNLKHLRLQSNNIDKVEAMWFPVNSSVEELFLSHNRISHLCERCFENLSNLNNLHLAENHLQTLHEESFRGLTSLKYLILRRNIIESLPLDVFRGLTQLTHLELQGNLIETIDPRTFRTNDKLSGLILSNNRLTCLHPDTLQHLRALQNVDLNENRLVEYNFGSIHTQTIRLTDNHLRELQFNPNTTHIKAENNQIERILVPISFQLFDLQVGGNKIRDLSNITTISTLQALYLSRNGITSLPEDFRKLTRLTFLDLSYNNLTNLSFGSWRRNFTMASLNELRINGNDFSHLQLDFLDFFPNLQFLYICENPWNDTFLREFITQCSSRNISLIDSNCSY
ncbi:leucine-rich repeat-containing protein 15-like [Phlebotomus argentipes]|uniref:leucine-rich repeat-containing protein 15-like n=1 Tax=Phlebotomus argentipes TaxID=94469 RepID=UPI0028935E18|nr:leucine-rich repeat-containing protein 15-like [Phlebotomus argentipes]XP_059621020.1 leucine-rich repeat-containing protein 15-like [Phlebotomus argentipes]